MLGGKKSGGMNVYVRELSKTLGALGIKVDVFTRLQNKCQAQISTALGDNVRVIHIKAGPFEPMGTTAMKDHVEEFSSGIIDFLDSEGDDKKYDLIHSHYWLSGLVAEKLNKKFDKKIPVIQMFHTLGLLKDKYASEKSEKVSEIRIIKEQHVITEVADVIVAATSNEQTELVELYHAESERIKIIPPGVDMMRFQPIDKTEAKNEISVNCGDQLILFAGRIEKLKGIDTLLHAMDVLDSWNQITAKEKCIVIVGGDPWNEDSESEMARLIQLTDDLDINKNVAFVGAKDQMSLPLYYAAADVVVMPSHYESFGMVALEAMAMGRPVIASEVGGLAELVVDGVNGLHVESRDPEGLAKAINELLSDDAYRSRLGQGAIESAKKYDWKNIADQVTGLYNDLLSL